MASIWFCSGLAFLLGEPASKSLEMDALEWAADYFRRHGHAVEVIADPRELADRLRARLPDVLVTDMPPVREVLELVSQPVQVRKPVVVLLASIQAECGSALEIETACPGLVDAYVMRPYGFRMSREEKERFRIYLPFSEQLIVTVGHLLHARGLDTP